MAHDDELDIPPFLDRRNKLQQTLPVMAGTKNTSRDTISTAIANLPELIERAAARLLQDLLKVVGRGAGG